jgi:hypothetical protein
MKVAVDDIISVEIPQPIYHLFDLVSEVRAEVLIL